MGCSREGAVGICAERGQEDGDGRAGDLGAGAVDVGVGNGVFDPVLEVEVDAVGRGVEFRAPEAAAAGCGEGVIYEVIYKERDVFDVMYRGECKGYLGCEEDDGANLGEDCVQHDSGRRTWCENRGLEPEVMTIIS